VQSPRRGGTQHRGWVYSPKHPSSWSTESNSVCGSPHWPARETTSEHRPAALGVRGKPHSPSKAGAYPWGHADISRGAVSRPSLCKREGRYSYPGRDSWKDALSGNGVDRALNFAGSSARCRCRYCCGSTLTSSSISPNRHGRRDQTQYLTLNLTTGCCRYLVEYLTPQREQRALRGTHSRPYRSRRHRCYRRQQTPTAANVRTQDRPNNGLGANKNICDHRRVGMLSRRAQHRRLGLCVGVVT
jgi:hypothetical protein